MIPTVFISSTISDLLDIRFRIRTYIDSIGFHPVMSEHGEVPYLPRYNAKDSCYEAVTRSNMLILLIGRRFGTAEESGKSVVQREHEAAIQASIPVFALVDRDVMTAKTLYEKSDGKNPPALDGTDDPAALYNFINQVTQSNTNNGIIVFDNVEDAIAKLRKQIAGYIGDLISDQTGPISSRLKDIFADIKAIRTKLETDETQPDTTDPNSPIPLRILSKLYRKLVKERFDNIRNLVASFDLIVTTDPYVHLIDSESWKDFLANIGVQYEYIDAKSNEYQNTFSTMLERQLLIRATGVRSSLSPKMKTGSVMFTSEPKFYMDSAAEEILDLQLKELREGLS